MYTLSKVNMADSSLSESSSISWSDYFDFEASLVGENNDRAYEAVGQIRPWRFEPPGRNENKLRESHEYQEPVRRSRLNQESDEW